MEGDEVTAEAEAPEVSEDQIEESETLEAGEPEAADDTEESPVEEKPKRRDRSYQKRIGKLTAEKREAERQVAILQSLIEQRQQAPQAENAPKREDFDDYEAYLEAKASHSGAATARQELAKARDEQAKYYQQSQEQQQLSAFNEARENLFDKGSEMFADFDEVASAEFPVSEIMADGLLVTKNGHVVLHHLGKNPKEAERISLLSPQQQLIELGVLSATLSAPKKASGAPSPTTKIGQQGTTSNSLKDNLPIKEWMARRNKELRR